MVVPAGRVAGAGGGWVVGASVANQMGNLLFLLGNSGAGTSHFSTNFAADSEVIADVISETSEASAGIFCGATTSQSFPDFCKTSFKSGLVISIWRILAAAALNNRLWRKLV